MRRILAIGILVFVIFLGVLVVVAPIREGVSAWVVTSLGPAIGNALLGVWASLEAMPLFPVVVGFAIVFYILGNMSHWLWHKADWKFRRWGQQRTASDLGTTLTTSTPSTPSYATTRPETKEPLKVLPISEMPKPEQTKEEPSTA